MVPEAAAEEGTAAAAVVVVMVASSRPFTSWWASLARTASQRTAVTVIVTVRDQVTAMVTAWLITGRSRTRINTDARVAN